MCIRIEYIFQSKKKRRQKTKEAKDEKRICMENLTGFDDSCASLLCVILAYFLVPYF